MRARQPHARSTVAAHYFSISGSAWRNTDSKHFCMQANVPVMVQFGLVHVSAGDLLRAEVLAGTDAGKRAESFMSQGYLVPNELVRARPALCPWRPTKHCWGGHIALACNHS